MKFNFLFVYNMRKRLNYNQMVDKYQTFEIPLPNRKATNILNHPIISNLLSAAPEEINNITNKVMLNKFTQTPNEQWTQTEILDKETQEDYIPQHHDLYPHLYYKIDAFSKWMPHDTDVTIKNDSTSQTIDAINNINQTSSYIPSSLKQKADNINQTVRYILKDISPQSESAGDYSEWYQSLERQEPPQQIETPNDNPGLLNWLINLALPNPPPSNPPSIPPSLPPSIPPSVPAASVPQSSVASPISYIAPSPPSSPSPVAYPASSDEEEERRSSRGSKLSFRK